MHVAPTFPAPHSGQLPIVMAPGQPHPDEQLFPEETQRKSEGPFWKHVNSQIPEHPAAVVVVLEVDVLVDDVLVEVEDVLVEVELVEVDVDDVLVEVELVDVEVEDVLVVVEVVDVVVEVVVVGAPHGVEYGKPEIRSKFPWGVKSGCQHGSHDPWHPSLICVQMGFPPIPYAQLHPTQGDGVVVDDVVEDVVVVGHPGVGL